MNETGYPENTNIPKPAKKSSFLLSLLSWVKTVAFAFALALLITTFVIANASVESGSMENTVMTGERVICNRLVYLFSDPQRYDIVLFKFPYADEPVNYVKRVIGLPGDKVEILGGKVYINDSETPLIDSFTPETPRGDYGPFFVPEGSYFVLGDNRNRSFDSKSWDNPFISRDTLIGKAIFSYYPEFKIHSSVEN